MDRWTRGEDGWKMERQEGMEDGEGEMMER